MKALSIALGLLTCGVLRCYAGDLATRGAANSEAAQAVAPERIWAMYAQEFARDLRGPERAAERVVAFTQAMTNHPPIALIRLSPLQRTGLKAMGTIQGRVSYR